MSEERREGEGERGEKKVIAIRGIDERLYKEALRLSREIGWTVGELINKSLTLFLSTFPALTESAEKLVIEPAKELVRTAREAIDSGAAERYVIRDLEAAEISRRDLEEADKPIAIHSVRRVVIAGDVDFELFDSKVQSISFVDELVVPETFPRVKLYTKLRHVRKVTFTGSG